MSWRKNEFYFNKRQRDLLKLKILGKHGQNMSLWTGWNSELSIIIRNPSLFFTTLTLNPLDA